MKQRFLSGVFIGLIGVMLVAGAVSAAAGNQGMSGMGTGKDQANTSKTDPAADRTSFLTLWAKDFAAAALTPDQNKQLTQTLDEYAGKIADNYTVLTDLMKQKGAAMGNNAAVIQKRIDLQLEERDLILSNVEMALNDFLSQDQTALVLMAGFHGTSPQHSGAHQVMPGMSNNMSGMGNQMNPLQQAAMDLGELAGRINGNYQAVTLDMIRDFLKMPVMK